MVQQTLDATKSFIFDVRPMVLDDLGLLATLRRAARERGRRAGIPIDFDSMGQDRRLPTDLESGLFRIVDDALAAYLNLGPDHMSLKAGVGGTAGGPRRCDSRGSPAGDRPPRPRPSRNRRSDSKDEELPPALAAMIEERRADDRDAAEAARIGTIVVLPESTWREIQARAATIDVTANLLDEGSQLVLVDRGTQAGA